MALRNACSPGRPDVSHLFLIPEEDGKVKQIRYNPEKLGNLGAGKWMTLYHGKPAEGWVALVNQQESIGILFLTQDEHLTHLTIRKGATLNQLWGNPEIMVHYKFPRVKLKGLGGEEGPKYDGFRSQVIRKLRYCLVDLKAGNIEEEVKKYQDLYQWWINPPENRVKRID